MHNFVMHGDLPVRAVAAHKRLRNVDFILYNDITIARTPHINGNMTVRPDVDHFYCCT